MHAAIPGFLNRATRRMWDTAQARPSPQVLAIARQLIADPNAPLPGPQTDSTGVQPPDQPDEDDLDAGESPPPAPVRGGAVTMTAEHNQQVYQAAGDQYISGP